MTVEELDLARAKDLLTAMPHGADFDKQVPHIQQDWLRITRAIRLGDEARGLRVLPVVEITPEMMKAGFDALEDGCPPDQIFRSMVANAPFQSMPINECAASPFAPEKKG